MLYGLELMRKSTFYKPIMEVLGDYGPYMSFSTLKRSYKGGDAPNEEIQQLKGRIASLEQQLRDKENELGYLRMEYSKLNDALAQRLLAEATPKKSFWDKIRGR